jgi:hypothetical protein
VFTVKTLFSLALALLLPVVLFAQGTERKIPPGWKEVAKDSFSVLVPEKTPRTSNRERTFTSRGQTYKSKGTFWTAADGVVYSAVQYDLPAAAVRGKKPEDVLGEFIPVVAEQFMGQVRGNTDASLSGMAGREILLSGQAETRVRIFAAKTRIYQLAVGGSASQIAGAQAKIFLDSFRREEQVADKEPPAKGTSAAPTPAVPGTLPDWTADLAKMAAPETLVAGKLLGKEFTLDKAQLVARALELRMGKEFHPDASVRIVFFLKKGENLPGKSVSVSATDTAAPTVTLAIKPPGGALPTVTETFFKGYSLKLDFGQAKGGVISGRIYLCTPDAQKSVVAGTFNVGP